MTIQPKSHHRINGVTETTVSPTATTVDVRVTRSRTEQALGGRANRAGHRREDGFLQNSDCDLLRRHLGGSLS